MKAGLRAALALVVAGGFGCALASLVDLTGTGPVGTGSVDRGGADGTGGTAAEVADPLASWKARDDGRDPTRDTEDEEST